MYLTLLDAITPINIKEEKTKFFSNNFNYNPQFKYKWEEMLIERNNYKNPFKKGLVYAVLDQDLALIVENAKGYFSTDIEKYKTEAELVIKNSEINLLTQNVDKLAEKFQKALNFFELSEYKVEIVDLHGFSCRPKTKIKTMQISKYANLDLASIEGTIRHEMVHILRHENKLFNGLKKSLGYLSTEEGLASFLQDRLEDSGYSKFQHAAEYIGSEIGVNGSFVDLFNYFLSIGFTHDLAWKRASRHKFGFKDTSKPGDIIKPAMYFYHENRVGKLTVDEILKLFIGKIAIEDLKDYPKYTGRFSENKLKEFFKLD